MARTLEDTDTAELLRMAFSKIGTTVCEMRDIGTFATLYYYNSGWEWLYQRNGQFYVSNLIFCLAILFGSVTYIYCHRWYT
jgi:hypothetical protein